MSLFSKISLIFLLAAFFISCSTEHEYKSKFEFSPASPSASDEIAVYYMKDSTSLSEAEHIEMIAYVYTDELLQTIGVDMINDGKGYKANFTPDENAHGVVIIFREKDGEIKDDNSAQGYRIDINKDLADAGFASALVDWGYEIEIEDAEKSFEIFETVFSKNQTLMPKYADAYLGSIWRSNPESRLEIVGSKLDELAKVEEKDQKLLETIVNWANRAGKELIAEEYKKVLNEKFPNNKVVQAEEYSTIRREPDMNIKLQMAREFDKKYPESDFTENLFYYVVEDFKNAGAVNEAIEIIKENPSRPNPYIYSRFINYCLENGKTSEALEVAKIYSEFTASELAEPKEKQPKYLSNGDWLKNRKQSNGNALNFLAKSQLATDLKAEALNSAKAAVDLTESEDADINFTYAKALFINEKMNECLEFTKGFIASGKSTSDMKALLKDVFVIVNGNENGLPQLMKELESKALAGVMEKLATEMINEPAPQFTLTDFNGNNVSLADYKGKTVIVDFWATWCGPCRVSFPGMQKAVDKYSADENVQFLFVNTWERVENKLDNAKSFIDNNKYTFKVLMDYDNKVVTDFKVSGIPTKFVIDGNGNIRFKSIGGDDNIDRLVNEITAMVNLASQGV